MSESVRVGVYKVYRPVTKSRPLLADKRTNGQRVTSLAKAPGKVGRAFGSALSASSSVL